MRMGRTWIILVNDFAARNPSGCPRLLPGQGLHPAGRSSSCRPRYAKPSAPVAEELRQRVGLAVAGFARGRQ